MAAFTTVDAEELDEFLTSHAIAKCNRLQPVEGGSVNSNFSVICGPKRYFLRLYEEQDDAGAAREQRMVAALVAAGVPTPIAVATGTLSRKPAAVFPWIDGVHSCQRAVSAGRARAVGEALARVHRSNAPASESRFDEAALRKRLATIDSNAFPVARLARTLDALTARARDLPSGVVHGDLFRDNVLFEAADSDHVVALLDFESASRGAFAYDLAVTALAWCFGDAFDASRARAMIEGYASVRPIEAREKDAFRTEMRMAALRFTITRITDYAMRAHDGTTERVMKDWRRFLARLDAVESMGDARALFDRT